MQLIETIFQQLDNQKNPKNDSTIIPFLAHIQYGELNEVEHFFNNSVHLEKFVRGWLPIHYATLNPDPRVVQYLCQLYIRHGVSLCSTIKTTKNQCQQGFSALDIAVVHKSVPQYLILQHYGCSNELSLRAMFSYLLSNRTIHKNLVPLPLVFPQPDNIITRFSFLKHDFFIPVTHFLDNYYEEKNKLLDGFRENHHYLIKFFLENDSESDIYIKYKMIFEHTAEKIQHKMKKAPPLTPASYQTISDMFYEPVYQKLLYLVENPEKNWDFHSEIRIYKNLFLKNDNDLSLFYDINNDRVIKNLQDSQILIAEISKNQPDVHLNILNDLLTLLRPILDYNHLQTTLPKHIGNVLRYKKI